MKRTLTVVADENMPGVEACLAHLQPLLEVNVRRLPGRQLQASQLTDCDWLLVRSVTRVDARLLAQHQPRFIGTATIGTDHLALDYLAQQGIPWSAAPGCNARAVAEWAVTVITQLLARQSRTLTGVRLGIVGLGHVGSAVARLATALGLKVSAYDPFLQQASVPLVSLPELLGNSDVVSLHTPLTLSGAYPTKNLIDAKTLALMSPDAWLINAGRGEVVDADALTQALQQQSIAGAVLDVWPNEPQISASLLDLVHLGSPHIAGHSLEGKWRGTWQIVSAACAAAELPAPPALETLMPEQGCLHLSLPEPAGQLTDIQRLANVLSQCADVLGDDQRLRQAMHSADPVLAFDHLRRDYPVRREFMAHDLPVKKQDLLRRVLCDLGFRC